MRVHIDYRWRGTANGESNRIESINGRGQWRVFSTYVWDSIRYRTKVINGNSHDIWEEKINWFENEYSSIFVMAHGQWLMANGSSSGLRNRSGKPFLSKQWNKYNLSIGNLEEVEKWLYDRRELEEKKEKHWLVCWLEVSRVHSFSTQMYHRPNDPQGVFTYLPCVCLCVKASWLVWNRKKTSSSHWDMSNWKIYLRTSIELSLNLCCNSISWPIFGWPQISSCLRARILKGNSDRFFCHDHDQSPDNFPISNWKVVGRHIFSSS